MDYYALALVLGALVMVAAASLWALVSAFSAFLNAKPAPALFVYRHGSLVKVFWIDVGKAITGVVVTPDMSHLYNVGADVRGR